MKNERLLSLRNQMKEAGVHCMVIPTSDYHNSEYVSDFFMARKYFSGFTGSAGTLVVTPDEAALFTDGRYFIQAAKELKAVSYTHLDVYKRQVFLCEYPYEGSIRFDDVELADMEPSRRAAIVGYLGHDPELMNDTLENNILMGDVGDAGEYLRQVCLKEEADAMADGLQTKIGSSGVRLSGGQAQRDVYKRQN